MISPLTISFASLPSTPLPPPPPTHNVFSCNLSSFSSAPSWQSLETFSKDQSLVLLVYKSFALQVYHNLSFKERRLFEDPEFPACDSSLFFSKRPPKLIEWRRPGVCLFAFFVYGIDRLEVINDGCRSLRTSSGGRTL